MGNDVHGGVTNAWSISGDFAALTLRSGDADAFPTFLAHEGVAHMVSRPVLPASAAAPVALFLAEFAPITSDHTASAVNLKDSKTV